MPGMYAETGQENAVTAGLTTVLHVTGGTGLRARLYDFTVSCSGTPADNAVRWTLMRYTVAPTSTAVVPTPLDPADPAAEATAGENATVEGTYTAASELFDQAFNERAGYRWVAAPEGELIVPAVAANGIGVRVLSTAYTGAADASVHHRE